MFLKNASTAQTYSFFRQPRIVTTQRMLQYLCNCLSTHITDYNEINARLLLYKTPGLCDSQAVVLLSDQLTYSESLQNSASVWRVRFLMGL